MRRKPPSLALLAPLLISWVVAVPPAESQVEVRRVEQEFFLGEAHQLEVDLTIGDLVVEGTDEERLGVELVLDCRRDDLEKCRERANRIRLEPRATGERFSISLRRTPREKAWGIDARMTLRVPSRMALEVDVRSGDVTIRGMRWWIEVDAANGDIDIVHRHDLVGQVNVAVGIGQADLWLHDGKIEGRGFPKSVAWKGPGEARVEVDAGTGNAAVRLE